MWKKTAAACLIAGIVTLGAPTAASAQIDDDAVGYVASATVTVNPATAAPCLTSTITFGEGFWAPSAAVAISIEGYQADDATLPSSATATSDGALVAKFTPPADGRANYRITFASAARTHTSVVSVVAGAGVPASCDDDPGAGTAVLGASSSSPGALATTGSDPAPWLVAGGAGMLLAGGVILAVQSAQRRRS